MPARADENTVFADGSGVSYSKDDGDNSTIKKQIKNNLDKLNSMNPVATVNETNLPKGKGNIRNWAVELLKATGYKVERQCFGVIEFSSKHIDEGIKYLSEDAEVAAFAALPRVLKRGIVIDTHKKHKGNLRDSVTIAAPVVINGVRGNMAVAITVTTKNHYHVHRVVMPDGSRFTFDVNKKTAESTLHSAAKAGEEAKDSAYEYTIPYSSTESKTKYSARERDAEYMEAVNTGDTETAQRLVDEAAEDALEESEVRDANGLTAVYHATYNSFTVFERKRLGQNTTGFASDNFVEATAYLGFWFNTQDLSNTVSYAGARGMKCFLNITNPYRTNTQYLAREIENDWNEELSVKENADDYVDYLKRNGYDGIILKDFEFGGTSFVAFDSEQIKSAEAITYDDKGNVIPLSERFNKSDSDIRYSMRDNLKDDLEKVKKRQFDFQNSEVLIGETSDFLVNEIGFRPLPFYMPATKAYRAIVTEEQAKKDGQPTGGSIHYHGLGVDGVYNILARAETPTAAYVATEEIGNKRDNRIVLVTDVNVNGGLGVVVVEPNTMAQERGGRRAANKTITLYDRQSVTGAVQKAYDQGRLLYIDKKSGQRFDSGRRGSDRPSAISEDVRERNIQQFWENVKWRELNNSGIFSAGDMTNSTMAEAFKRAEGKAKYSMRDNAIADTPEQRREREMSYADLKRRNVELERRAEYWKAQTKETQQATVRKADTDKLARRITQELGVTDRETISELKDELKRLGDQIVQSTGAELSYSELKERALDMADELLGNISVQLDNTNEDALNRLRGYLSSTKLRMNEREMADLPEGWRREHRRIKLSKDGVPVDTAYMELQEMFGEGTFPSYITAQADMLQQIADVEAFLSCLSVRHIAIHSFLCYNS